MDNKFIITGMFFALIILSGFWLSRSGRPLNAFILTAHKLIALGAVVFLAMTVYRIDQMAPLSPVSMTVCVVTVLFFIAMIVTGGLLSTAKIMPTAILKIHQMMPYLVILSTTANLYILLARKL